MGQANFEQRQGFTFDALMRKVVIYRLPGLMRKGKGFHLWDKQTFRVEYIVLLVPVLGISV